MEELLTVPTIVTVSLELIKKLVRLIKKNPTYDFPMEFYGALLPLVTLTWQVVFGMLGWAEPVAIEIQSVVQLAVSSLLAVAMYQLGLKPLKEYGRYL